MNAPVALHIEQAIVSYFIAATLYGAIAAAIGATALILLPGASASFRAGLLLLAMTTPFVCALTTLPAPVPSGANGGYVTRYRPAPSRHIALSTAPRSGAPRSSSAGLSPSLQRASELHLNANIVDALALLWLFVTVVLLGRLFAGVWKLHDILRGTTALPPALESKLLAAIRKRTNIPVRLRASASSVMPLALGLKHSAIVIPTWMLQELSSEDLERIVLHEVAHIIRRDALLTITAGFVSATAWFSPGLLWLHRRFCVERELACDEWAVEAGQRRSYALCLAGVATRLSGSREPYASHEAFLGSSGTLYRIQSLVTGRRTAGKPITAVFALALAYAGVWICTVSPAIAVERNVQPISGLLENLGQLNYRDISASDLILLRTLRVPIRYVAAMHGVGMRATLRDIADMYVLRISPAYATAMHAAFPQSTASDIERLSSVGASGSYVGEMLREFGRVDVNSIVGMRQIGVSVPYLRMLAGYGYDHIAPQQVIALKTVGVNLTLLESATRGGKVHPTLVALLKERFSK